MLLFETLKVALSSIRANLFRSFLTMLGIIIGVAAVITLVALGTGAQRAIDEEMATLGGDVLLIESPIFSRSGLARINKTLTYPDYRLMRSELTQLSLLVPEINSRFQVKLANQNQNLLIVGTTPLYQELNGIDMAAGRFYSEIEEQGRKRVAVLGTNIPSMFGLSPEAIVGRTLSIRGIGFIVVGVIESKGMTGGRRFDESIWVPLSTARFRLAGSEFLDRISARVADYSSTERALLDIERVLRRAHGIRPGSDNDFDVVSRSQIADMQQKTAEILTFLLVSIAGVSLLVGGIGIMNIMLVTVTERTREIGIRKSLGATNGNILLQFLIESTTLCLLGGLTGLGIGNSAALLLGKTAGLHAPVTLESAAMALGFSAFVGIVFGIMPAQRAASLDPIEALRNE
ncbi:MAG: ABC transporter permease [Pseudomonadota bacterium]